MIARVGFEATWTSTVTQAWILCGSWQASIDSTSCFVATIKAIEFTTSTAE